MSDVSDRAHRNEREPLAASLPQISVIVLNYNGARWLERCLGSLREQTVFSRLEIIVADNNSPDGSAQLAAEIMRGWVYGKVIQHGENLGFCEGNNRAATQARGEWLFFLNNDTWLEADCLEKLVAEVARMGAQAGTPLMLNYDDDSVQSSGGAGFDIFGLMSLEKPHSKPKTVFVAGGCSYLIRRDWFENLGGFDPVFYMYADEYDLSWRAWVAGARIVSVPAARIHHRGAAGVNPMGGEKIMELRTSDSKRFFSNRNCLLLLLKNCQHLLLLLVPLQLSLLALEACVGGLMVRRWSFVKRAYLDVFWECWRLRYHVLDERKRMKQLRQHSDWWMIRFFRLRLNRWDDLQLIRHHGIPKIADQ